MRIAVIGWGSLIWQRRDLDIEGRWHTTGPSLPIEFARRSENGRLTLVILNGADVQQTYWALSRLDTLDAARENLRERERTTPSNIHWATHAAVHADEPAARLIQDWLSTQQELDAAIWTGLSSTFNPKDAVDHAVAYLTNLEQDSEAFRLAHEYVTNAPPQIQTRVRQAMRDRGWNDAAPSPTLFES